MIHPIIYQGNYLVRIADDKYDFEMHPWSSLSESLRNVETIGARVIHGKGIPFKIKFKGLNKIHHMYNKIKNLII